MFLGVFLILVSCECFVTILSRHTTGFLGLVRVFPEVELLFLLSFIYFSFSPLFPLGLFHRILQPFYLCPFVISKSLLFEKNVRYDFFILGWANCPLGGLSDGRIQTSDFFYFYFDKMAKTSPTILQQKYPIGIPPDKDRYSNGISPRIIGMIIGITSRYLSVGNRYLPLNKNRYFRYETAPNQTCYMQFDVRW